MIYGSVCSGVEAASLAWEPIGFKPAWFAEIEPFPSAVLAHHWPHVTNLGDMTRIATAVIKGDVAAPDILVGGTPCQAFSVAGAREGLADERGFLTIKYVELANAIDQQRTAAGKQPCITVWENVPGVLSSKDNAFGAFLGFLAGSDIELEPGPRPAPGKQSKVWGWCKTTRQHFVRWSKSGCVLGPQRAIAWRILDAQHFGVAQRRRRVFVVASAREGFDPAKVLLEREGVRRDSAPSREAGKAVAALTANGVGTCGADDNQGQAGHLIAKHLDVDCIGTLTAGFGKVGAPEVDAYTCIPWASHVSGTLNANGKAAGSATQQDAEAGMLVVHGTQDPDTNIDLAHTLGRNHGQENAVLVKGVRRLTPVECERLQGFPDNHTLIPWAAYQKAMRKAESGMPITATASEVQAAKIAALYEPGLRDQSTEDCPDGPRYKAIGNSMARPCMEFIGLRIDLHLSEIDLPAVDEEAA